MPRGRGRVCGDVPRPAAACERLLGHDRGRRAAALGLLVAIGVFGSATWLRSGLYASRQALWQDVVAKAPWNPRGWQTLGLELMAAGRFDAALAAFDRSVALVDREPVTHLAWSYALLELGRPAEAVAAARARLAARSPAGDEAVAPVPAAGGIREPVTPNP